MLNFYAAHAGNNLRWRPTEKLGEDFKAHKWIYESGRQDGIESFILWLRGKRTHA